MEADPTCTRCPLHLTTTRVCIPGHGNQRARIVLVGEAPGADEEREGIPFIGQAGRTLDEMLLEADINRADVFITNTVRCRPPKNRTPNAGEMQSCIGYLASELVRIEPSVIVALGGTALKALTGRSSITKERGKPLPALAKFRTQAPVLGTFHPASLLYSGGRNREHIVSDLRAAKSMLKEQRKVPVHFYTPSMYDAKESDVLRHLNWLKTAPIVACDLEWKAGPNLGNGKHMMLWPWNPYSDVFSISLSGRVGDTIETVALALPMPAIIETSVREILARNRIIFHNAMSDMIWLVKLKMRVNLSADTMLLGHLIDETQPLGLEPLATKYSTMSPGWKGHIRDTRPLLEADWIDLLQYNGTDTYATLMLFEGLVAELERIGVERRNSILRIHNRLLLPALPILLRAAYLGVPIDRALLQLEMGRAAKRYEEAIGSLAKMVGLTPPQAKKFASSPQQVKEYLQRRLAIVDVVSTNKDVLNRLLDYPAVQKILECRGEQKTISTYLAPWATLLDEQKDGRLHSLYRPTGTRTGRLSTQLERGGPIQVAPRDSERISFRKMIRARDGWVFVGADFSQIELRVLAWLAPERTMYRFYTETDIDLHRATAAFVKARAFNISLDDFLDNIDEHIAGVTKLERQDAKGINFGFAYGMQEGKYRLYVLTNYGRKVTADQAREERDAYFTLYPDLLDYHDRMRNLALRGEPTITPFGRYRHYTPNDANAAINTPIQSTASDITLLCLSQVERVLRTRELRGQIIATIHDSILVECPEDEAEEIAGLMREVMESVDTSEFRFDIPIPIIAETKISQVWS